MFSCCLSYLARTTPIRKTEEVIGSYIFYISIGLEKFTGAILAQIEPLVEMLSSF